MSVSGKKWIIKNKDPNLNVFDKLIHNRPHLGLKNELKDFHDPYLFSDMEKSVARVKKAIENKERIIIFGDYDVDGITGTAILVHALRHLGATVSFRLPNRVTDGYGLSKKFIDEFIEKKIDLVITTDCGISCAKEVKQAQENGIDVIITDHHSIPETVPKAYSIIHPKHDKNYPFDELTGAGVAFKFAQALIESLSQENGITDALLDLAALGTVADLGILHDENRLIVKRGVQIIKKSQWNGLNQIIRNSGVKPTDKIDSTTMGFRLAPRINAAGRIGDPYTALFLLLQKDPHPQINNLASKLEELNTQRRAMTSQFFFQLVEKIDADIKVPDIIIDQSPEWHVGVLGLVASKAVEKYNRPAIIMEDRGDTLVGSARSINGFNIVEAISKAAHLLENFGGHPQAAGLSIKKENLKEFKKILSEHAKKSLKKLSLQPTIEIDCALLGRDLTIQMLRQINSLAPFGMGNTKPTFVIKNVEPIFVSTVGQNHDHLKFSIRLAEKDIPVIAFSMGKYADKLKRLRSVDIVFHLDLNVWNGKENLQLMALDFQHSQE